MRAGRMVRLAALGVCAASPLLAQGAGAGPTKIILRRSAADTTRRDSVVDVMVTISPDGIARMIGDLMASQAMEERMAMALRGEPMDGARARELQSQLMAIARRNSGLSSAIRLQCAADASQQPDGYMGVNFSAMEVRRAKDGPTLYYFSERPTILSVEPGSPAERAGIEAGDDVVMIGGTDVRKPLALESMLKPGVKLPIRVMRDGRSRDLTVVVEKRPSGYGSPCSEFGDGDVFMKMAPPAALPKVPSGQVRVSTSMPPEPPSAAGGFAYGYISPYPMAGPRLIGGAELGTLTDDWRELLGVDRGVLIVRVAKGSPASDAGLRGGDVVIAAGDTPVTEPRHLITRVNASGREPLTLKIVRLKKEMQLVVKLGGSR